MTLTFCLVHSPLVGPTTWRGVAAALEAAGHAALVPTLGEPDQPGQSYAGAHIAAVAQALSAAADDGPLVLAGHSGAGPLLPAIGDSLSHPSAACLFVDAGIPRPGASRLDLIREEAGEWAEEFAGFLAQGGRFPGWSEDDLAGLIPDPHLRRQVVAEIQPRGIDFFTEPIPTPTNWPSISAAYLQFSPAYDVPAARAVAAGWPCVRLDGGHFHMLVAPEEVAETLTSLATQLFQEDR